MFKGLIVGLLMLFFAPALVSAAVGLDDVVEALETPFKWQTKKSERIQSFQADFFQQSHIASIDRTQQGRGSVSFKFAASAQNRAALAKFRWEYLEPTIQEIISDGQTMWVYLPENRQVVESDIRQLNTQQGENPLTFLSGLGNLSRDFWIDWGDPRMVATGGYRLQLVPRKESQFIRNIEVIVSESAVRNWVQQKDQGAVFPILATLITDPNGNRTAIEFQKVRVNPPLEVQIFTFERPDGVDLVDFGEHMAF